MKGTAYLIHLSHDADPYDIRVEIEGENEAALKRAATRKLGGHGKWERFIDSDMAEHYSPSFPIDFIKEGSHGLIALSVF